LAAYTGLAEQTQRGIRFCKRSSEIAEAHFGGFTFYQNHR